MKGNNPVDQINCSAAFTDRKYGLISAYQDTTDLFSFSFVLGTRALSLASLRNLRLIHLFAEEGPEINAITS